MDGLVRHVCMPKHRNAWLAHTDAPPSARELHASLSRNCVPDKVEGDETHKTYVAKRTVTKIREGEKARKVMRQAVVAGVTEAVAGATAGGAVATPRTGGNEAPSPFTSPAFNLPNLPPITPENAAAIGAMIAAMPVTTRIAH